MWATTLKAVFELQAAPEKTEILKIIIHQVSQMTGMIHDLQIEVQRARSEVHSAKIDLARAKAAGREKDLILRFRIERQNDKLTALQMEQLRRSGNLHLCDALGTSQCCNYHVCGSCNLQSTNIFERHSAAYQCVTAECVESAGMVLYEVMRHIKISDIGSQTAQARTWESPEAVHTRQMRCVEIDTPAQNLSQKQLYKFILAGEEYAALTDRIAELSVSRGDEVGSQDLDTLATVYGDLAEQIHLYTPPSSAYHERLVIKIPLACFQKETAHKSAQLMRALFESRHYAVEVVETE